MAFGPDASWRKSTFSDGGGGECVEVAWSVVAVGLRDSKDSLGPVVVVDQSGWAAFRRSITRA